MFDEKDWDYYTEDQKLCANTAFFSMPRYINGAPVDKRSVNSKVRHGSTLHKKQADIKEGYSHLKKKIQLLKRTESIGSAPGDVAEGLRALFPYPAEDLLRSETTQSSGTQTSDSERKRDPRATEHFS